jgi:hypothetical protein
MQQAVGQRRVVLVSDTVLAEERRNTDVCTDTGLRYWTQWLDIVLMGTREMIPVLELWY